MRSEAGAGQSAVEIPPDIIGGSRTLKAALVEVDTVAKAALAVLLVGETGTGKELVARRIHAGSGRSGRLVTLNCATLSAALAGSALFGHVRGAFTGADSDQVGAFELAIGGTLFLDEVGELEPTVQAQLLRAIEYGEFHRVGDQRPRRAAVRVVSATHRDLDAMAKQGAFRLDLLQRLRQFVVRVPPLRERGSDVLLLADHVLGSHVADRRITLTAPARAALLAHDWPGNVRELRNVLIGAAVRAGGDRIDVEHLRLAVASNAPGPLPERMLEALAARDVASASELASDVGVSRATATRWLRFLTDHGLIHQVDTGSSTRYSVGTTLSPHQRQRCAVILRIRRHGPQTRREIAHALGTSDATTKRLLAGLVSAGTITRQGTGRATFYALPGSQFGSQFPSDKQG